MKLILIILLLSFTTFASALEFSFVPSDKKQLRVTKVELIPTKVTEKLVSFKSSHGKVNTRKVPVQPMIINDQKKIILNKYFLKINTLLEKQLGKFNHEPPKVRKKQKNKKTKKVFSKNVIVKIQIQSKGRYDLLFVGSEIYPLSQYIEKKILKIKSFPVIPISLDVEELQLKISLTAF